MLQYHIHHSESAKSTVYVVIAQIIQMQVYLDSFAVCTTHAIIIIITKIKTGLALKHKINVNSRDDCVL